MWYLRHVLLVTVFFSVADNSFGNDIVLNGALDIPVWDLRVSPDEKIAVFIYRNGFLEIFERNTGKPVSRSHLPGVYSQMPAQFSFSPDLEYLAYCTEAGFPVVFRFPFAANRQPQATADAAGCRSAAISADGKRLYVLAERQLKVFSAATMKLQQTHEMRPTNDKLPDAVFSGGDRVYLSDADGNLYTLDESTSGLQPFIKHGSFFSPKGHRGTVAWLLPAASGDRYLSVDSKGHSLLWSPDGKVLDHLSGFVPFASSVVAESGFGSCLRVNIDFRDFSKIYSCGSDQRPFGGVGPGLGRSYGEAILSMAFTNGRLAVTVLHKQSTKLFALDTSGNFVLNPVDTFVSDTQLLAVAGNGNLGLIKNDNYYVFDPLSKSARTEPVAVAGYAHAAINDLRFWNSTAIFAVDADTAAFRSTSSLSHGADFMAGEKISPNRKVSAFVRKQGTKGHALVLRNLEAPGDLREIFTATEIQDFTFRKDRILVGTGNAELVVIDYQGNAHGAKWRLTNANPHYPVKLYFCAQGDRTVAVENNLATVYDSDGKIRSTKVLHAAEVTHLFFTQNCAAMITAGNDGMIKLWKLPSLEGAGTLLFSGGGWAFASPDGYYEGEGGALEQLHYRVNRDAVSLGDFDESFRKKGLLKSMLKNIGAARAAVSAPILAGKIFSLRESGIMFSGDRLNMGQRIFVIVSGKKHYGRVTFPMHTSARVEFDDGAVMPLLKAGMPVYR